MQNFFLLQYFADNCDLVSLIWWFSSTGQYSYSLDVYLKHKRQYFLSAKISSLYIALISFSWLWLWHLWSREQRSQFATKVVIFSEVAAGQDLAWCKLPGFPALPSKIVPPCRGCVISITSVKRRDSTKKALFSSKNGLNSKQIVYPQI